MCALPLWLAEAHSSRRLNPARVLPPAPVAVLRPAEPSGRGIRFLEGASPVLSFYADPLAVAIMDLNTLSNIPALEFMIEGTLLTH